jgi:hypothetical protein
VNCFYHTERAAVGTCRACGRGLCIDSLAELSGGLACRGRCESNVEAMASGLRHSAHVARIGSSLWLWYALLLVLYALGSFTYGLGASRGLVNAWTATGVISLLVAFVCFRISRKVRLPIAS